VPRRLRHVYVIGRGYPTTAGGGAGQASGASMRRFLVALALAWAPLSAGAQGIELRFIGQQLVPFGAQVGGTIIGGLSGLDSDPARGRFRAISDDRSQFGPARAYDLTLALSSTSFSSVSFTGVTLLRDEAGQTFPSLGVDPEAIRRSASGTWFWANEGDRVRGQNPWVREMAEDGRFLRAFEIPSKYLVNEGPGTGVRDNLSFESLALSPDGRTLVAANENALIQDGPVATTGSGMPIRLLFLDVRTGRPLREFVYLADPVAAPPVPPTGFRTSGLVELLAVSDTRMLALERSFSAGAGFSARIYDVSTAGATDVLPLAGLGSASYRPVAKTPLVDLDPIPGVVLTNVEGMS